MARSQQDPHPSRLRSPAGGPPARLVAIVAALGGLWPARAAADPTIARGARASLDYNDGTFFLRSIDDNLVIVTGGRVHIDTYAFAGPGVDQFHRPNGTGLTPTTFFRRFAIELGGLVRNRWFFWLGGNFAPTQIGADATPVSTAAVYDGFIGYQFSPWNQLYVGQFNAPLMMENVTSSRWLDLMERALIVRTVATPYNKDLGVMFWGATRKGAAPLEYQVGVFGGDGMNRPNVDDRFDLMARIVFRPAASAGDATQRFHIGVSGRVGTRNPDYVAYDAPALSTPGGYSFWSPTYSEGTDRVHIMPSGSQGIAALEVYAPFDRFDWKAEVVYANEGRREAIASTRSETERLGRFEGIGGYVQLSYWPWGVARVNGHPAGRYFGVKLPDGRGPEAPLGVQLVARAEMIRFSYDANARSPDRTEGARSHQTTDIEVNALQVAANWWATKHVRLTPEYSLYAFPGRPGRADNQAGAPSGNHLHELSFRLGLAL